MKPEEKLNGLKELARYSHMLKKCKWYEFYRKKRLKAIIEIVRNIYEL